MTRPMCGRLTWMVLPDVAMVAGCAKPEPQRKVVTRDGEITRIDQATGTVAMKTFVQKQQTFVDVAGVVTGDTQILVNDRPATLADLKIGDTVTVDGYSQGKGVDIRWVPLVVRVTRTDLFAAPASAPAASDEAASQPAESQPAP